MQTTRWMGMVLAAATCVSLHPSLAKAATTWSTAAAGCVPVNPSSISVTAGAVTAKPGMTATLYCSITRDALTGAFNAIEITYKGGASVVVSANTSAARAAPLSGALLISQFVEMSKATGVENLSGGGRCGFQPLGAGNPMPAAGIVTKHNGCENSSGIDFNNNFYYVRIVLGSGIIAGQQVTVYGTSLITQ
jgi:hypothetical protein